MNYKEFYFYLKGILANNTSLSKKQVDSLREEMEKVVQSIDIAQPLKDLDWKIPTSPVIRYGGTTGEPLQPRNAIVSDDYKCTHGYTNFDQ